MGRIKRIPVFWALLAITLSITTFYLSMLSRTTFFASLRLKSVDGLLAARSRSSPPLPGRGKIVVVGIDDASYHRMNTAWPWGREVFAVFLDKLQLLGPKVIVMDFTFVGKSSDPKVDAALAESIRRSGNVLLASFFAKGGEHIRPLETLSSAAAGTGFIDKPLDRDAIHRRARAAVQVAGGTVIYSLPIQAVCLYLGVAPEKAVRLERGFLCFDFPDGKKCVSTGAARLLWLPYRYRPETFASVPFWKVASGQADAALFKDRIVIVAPTSPVFHDVHRTPLGLMAGAHVNANEIASVLDRDFPETLSLRREWAGILALCALFTFLFHRLNVAAGLFSLVGAWAFFPALAYFLLARFNLLIEWFSPVWVVTVAYAVVYFSKALRTFFENVSLQRRVMHDDLTGLYGYRYLSLRLAREMSQHGSPEFCFVMIDVDNFKEINDRFGHEQGNAVLISVARLLKSGIRGNDLAARYGGDEFCLMLQNCNEKSAVSIVEKLMAYIRKTRFPTSSGVFEVTLSVGVCSSRAQGVGNVEQLVACADKALYRAKAAGRNTVRAYGEPSSSA